MADDLRGCAKKKPWPVSTFWARSSRSWSSFSIPSATTSSASDFPRSTRVRTMAADFAVLRGSGTWKIWSPGNYLFHSLPTQTSSPIPELIARGVNIALGTDTAKAWGFGDQALLGFLVLRADGESVPTQKWLDMSTIDAAEALGIRDEVGSIEVNKRADIVLRQPQLPEMHPGEHPVRNLLSLRTRGVDMVIVNGQIVLEDGHVTRVDEKEIFEVSRERAQSLKKRVASA